MKTECLLMIFYASSTKMDKFTKIKCLGCGILLTVIIGAESLPVICHKCHHVSVPHLPERNYGIEFNNLSTVAVSGITDTGTASIISWNDADFK